MLSDLNLKTSYKKTNCDISKEFYIPCMNNSIKYDRLSGYFSSTIFEIVWESLQRFINNSGRMRIVCSPNLKEEDIIGIKLGYDSKINEKLSNVLLESYNKMLMDEEKIYPSKLLACLISKGILEIKIAIHKNPYAIYHDKVGTFTDNYGNIVGFRGAMNETYSGLENHGNIESIEVFASWYGGRDKERTANAQNDFDEVWRNEVEDIIVCELPEAVKKKFIEVSNKEDISELLEKIVKNKTSRCNYNKRDDRILRPHQTASLMDWERKGRRGILEHATGSGKTFTSICAIRKSLSNKNEIPLIIVPSIDLLNQWHKELAYSLSDIQPRILDCSGKTSAEWSENLNLFSSITSKNRIILSTIQTASSDKFIKRINNEKDIFLVADEVHRYGSIKFRKIFSDINAGARLGLSATPDRYGDPDGTNAIWSYFENHIEPKYTISDAINDKVLTEYEYNPYTVELNENEQDNWIKLSKKIKKEYAQLSKRENGSNNIWNNNNLKSLLIRRSRILKTAHNKLVISCEIIHDKYKHGDKWIVYCDSIDQITELHNMLSQDYSLKSSLILEYHSELDSAQRSAILETFSNNSSIMLSVKCLDEGIDIPSVTHALIIASSKNPREFIQRRGRILRKCPGKDIAYLYDLIIVPIREDDEEDMTLSIVKSELRRAIEFGSMAKNSDNCIVKLKSIAIEHNINLKNMEEGGYEEDDFEEEQ